MLGLKEVFGRVLARGGIATANVAARLALAKSYPNHPLSYARIGRSLRREVIRR